jgi:hypothetical protein
MTTIEVRCKGGFAYLKGNNGARWLAVPPADVHHPATDAHLCGIRVRRDVLLDPNDPRFSSTLPGSSLSLDPFVVFTGEVTGLEIVGAQFAPPKPEALSRLPADGAPNGPVDADSSWASQEFIPNLKKLHPPQKEPVSDVRKAAFLMTLPDNTEWHGLAPRFDMQNCKWDFINQETNTPVIPRQAITDKVGFHLVVPLQTELRIHTAGTVETVSVDFSTTSEHPLFLTAGTESASEAGPNEAFEHFRQLYHLSDPDRTDIVLPVRRCPFTSLPAGDIFCPGGEGEGEDGGG